MRTIKNEGEAILYLTDCTLATVAHLAMLKSKTKSEYTRQINIAQTGIDCIKGFKIDVAIDSRIYNVLINESQTVREWVKQFEIETKTTKP